MREFVTETVRSLPKSGIRAFFDIVAERADIVSLGVGEPDFDTPWHIVRTAAWAVENGATHYTSNLGTPSLRREIAAYLARRFSARFDWKREILVTVGVSEALDLAFRAICDPGDEVLYHEPCFVAYPAAIRLARGTPVPVPTFAADGFRLSVGELEKRVTPRTKALLLNFPCNPTGAVLDEASFKALADFAVRHDILLLSDEVYTELDYTGAFRSFASLPELKDRLVLLNGFSKSWAMTGFRLGYACGPAAVIDAMMKIHQYGIMSAPTVSQAAGERAMREGDADVVRMREEYRRRRNFLVSSLRDCGLDTVMPDGAFYVFPSIAATGLSSEEFALRLLREQSVAAVPGSAFGASGEGFIRCSYATSMEKLKIAAERIAAFVKSL